MLTICLGLGLITANAHALSAEDIIILKNAGVSEKTIGVIDSSNAIYRAIFSIDEILGLKASGISDQFILNKIRTTGATVPEIESDAAHQRKLSRLESRLKVSADYLSMLVNNPNIIKLVKNGKVSGKDYAEIVKYLKQYALDEETADYTEKRVGPKSNRSKDASAPTTVPPGVIIYHNNNP